MSNIQATLARIEALAQQGRFQQAEAACNELVKRVPREAKAWGWLGVIALHCGRMTDAENALRQAAKLDRYHPSHWSNLAVAVLSQGKLQEAEECFRRALKLDSSLDSCWINLSGCLAQGGRWKESLEAAREALGRNPNSAIAWSNVGDAEQKLGHLSESQQAFERWLALDPGNLEHATKYAVLLGEIKRVPDAVRILEAVLSRGPTMSSALYALAYLEYQEWNLPKAEAIARQLVAGNPSHADGCSLLGTVLLKQSRAPEALAALRRAADISSDPNRHSVFVGNLSYAENVSPEQLLSEHRQWAAKYADPLLPATPPVIPSVSGQHPIRIGFVSKDVGLHPVTHLFLAALEHIDKGKCSLVFYSDRAVEDDYTARFRAVADTWHVTRGMTHEEVAAQIKRDQIDVLIDLMGHMGERLLLFARKPAPAQVTWLGYAATTGMRAMDFLLADRFHVRPGEESAYVEAVLRMPNGYACYAPPTACADVAALPARGAGHVTFGSFNNPAKFTPSIFNAWAEILRQVPGAKLFLKYGGLDQPAVQDSIRSEFARRSVDAARIVLDGWSPIHDLLSAYGRVDIALDTQPYSGGVTTCEALWMGVPVITYPGSIFASRHSTSHLSNAGFSEFIANDPESYVEKAVSWGHRLDELSKMRASMRDQVRRSPLCDAPRFARDFMDVIERAQEMKCDSR